MDRVVTAQAELVRQVARLAREGQVDADQEQLDLDRLEVLDSFGVVGRREPARTLGRGESGASLRVREDARRRKVPGLPKL
jgi:hypothetical protein